MINDIGTILDKYEPKVAELGYQLRSFLLQQLPNIQEQPDISGNVIGYGYGPGYKDSICTIIPSKKGIKLGFYKGTELPDPERLLTGTGKVHKYVEIRTTEDISSPPLHALLQAALTAHAARTK